MMEASFWHDRWQKNELGFHEGQANALLVAHFSALRLAAEARVFVPLCGKTRDIGWLLAQGHSVVGAELSRHAIDDLFADLGITPQITAVPGFLRYDAPGLQIFVGDFFDLTADQLGPVAAIYDRAALVALPPGMRDRYARRLIDLTGGGPQLLICFEYDQSVAPGPPFSIPPGEVRRLYDAQYATSLLACTAVKGGLRGKIAALETIWLLRGNG